MTRPLLAAISAGALVVSGTLLAASAAHANEADPSPGPPVELTVQMPEGINFASPGFVPVNVLTDDSVDASRIDPESVVLGNRAGAGVGVARDGERPLAFITDVDNDGRDDLVVHFDKDELKRTDELTDSTTTLTVSGSLADGRDAHGSDTVSSEVRLEVKFEESLQVRGANDALRARGRSTSLDRVRAVLEAYRSTDFAPLVQHVSAEELSDLAAEAEARSGESAPDLASWYQLTLPAEVNADDVIRDLLALPEVAYAYVAADPAPPPSTTPDFTPMQGYFRPAAEGIDADFAHRDPRTRGAGIRIVDLEYDWNPFHEDLQLDWTTDLGGTAFPRVTTFADEHGTAVFGQLVARDNGYGITGGVPDATMYGMSPVRQVSPTRTSWVPAEAMVYASQFLDPGDALLIEQQTVGPNGGTRYVPIEWMQSAFDATVLLTQLGVTVVATGGNGGENLDGPEFLGRFDRSVRDSGAIVVGAGSTTRERLSFSVYGSRVDLQGWGQNITTTGSNGNLQGGTNPANINIRYTRTFGGTSGAGPIVTSAVVAIQSYLKATGQEVWSAAQIAELLKETGTPQSGNTAQHIGPLPNLRTALRKIEVDAPSSAIELTQNPPKVGDWYVNPTVLLSADDGWGSGVARIEYRLDGGPWQTYDEPFRVLGPGQHTISYRATDHNGNVEEVNDLTFRNLPTPVGVTAQARCVAGKAYVAVQARNDHDAAVSITLESAHGERSFANVAPSGSAYQQFATRTASVAAGSVTVRATGSVDGEDVTTVLTTQHPAVNCAN